MPTLALALTGCARDRLNDRNTLGGSTSLAFLQDHTPGEPVSDQPSDAGLDRAAWRPTTLLVPVDGTPHSPTYASARRPIKLDQPRRIGLHPTPESALDLHSNQGERALEIAGQPFVALADVALLPFRAVIRPPWTWSQSPTLVMKRSPSTDTAISGSIHDAPPPSPAAPAAQSPDASDG